jgi:hypothetical protein
MKHRHGILLLAVLLVAGYWWLRYRSAEPAGVELAGAPSDTPTIYDGQAGATQAPMSTYSQQNSSIIGLILSHHPSYESPVGLAGGLGSYQGDANPSVLPVSSAPPITDATDGVETAEQDTSEDFLPDLAFAGAGVDAGASPARSQQSAVSISQVFYIDPTMPAGTDHTGKPGKKRFRPEGRRVIDRTSVDHTPTVRDTRSRRRRGRHRSRPARRSSVKQLHNIGGLGNLSHLSGLDY